jgi:hypothetical protein
MENKFMRPTLKLTILFFACLFYFSANAQDTTYKRNITTVRDTMVNINYDTTVAVECDEQFFNGDKINNPSKTFIITKAKKTITLKSFMGKLAMEPMQVLADLDNDGKKELVISDFTGGAHCCDEFFVFKNIAPNKYQYVFRTFGGNVCVLHNKQFVFDFYEQYGYFFTCFACAYEDKSDAAPIPLSHILLKYNRGKISAVPGDQELRSRIKDNLSKLAEQPYQKLEDDVAQDNGLRKEFALNLAVFYYSFGRNLVETKKLFDKYYKYPDAKKVWTQFVSQLNYLKMNNDF